MPTAQPKSQAGCDDLKKYVREVPDWPKPGILFYDITTLLKEAEAFARLIDVLAERFLGQGIDIVAGIEARGFIFAPALAYRLHAGFVPIRKPRKLPAETVSVTYDLEYGTDSLEVHRDAIRPGQKILLVDDLVATGGTAKAAADLLAGLGGRVVALAFVVELVFLNPRRRLGEYEIYSVLQYDR